MSGTDDARTPRRPRPERDSFYEKHGRSVAPTVIGDSLDDLPPAVVLSPADTEATLVIDTVGGKAEGEKVDTGERAVTRTDVRVVDDVVVTEPFAADDEKTADADEAAQKRRAAEHLTEDPLPYIEPAPQPTVALDVDDDYAATASTAYSDAVVAPVADYDEVYAAAETPARRGTLDLGLLILRVVVGAVFLVHGLQKLTGWWGGPGIDGFTVFLANNPNPGLGFTADAARPLAIVGGLCETIGGALLILGLLTPIAGASVLGVIIVAALYKVTLAGGLWFFAGQGATAASPGGTGIEYEIVLAAAAIALILAGPGTYSVDRKWGWARRPAWGSAAWLIIAIAGAVAVWVVFNGANPLARA